MTVPCKDCINRHVNCHSDCEKYKSWRQEMDVVRDRILDEKLKNRRIDDFRTDSVTRMQKRHKHS